MNWFEDDKGFWHNLDLLQQIEPPNGDSGATLSFTNGEQVYFDTDEWRRLKAQLLNSQRPADRRPESPAAALPSTSGLADSRDPKGKNDNG